MKNFLVKFKESTMSILPVVVIVLMVACTPFFNLKANEIQIFLESALGLIVGVTLFSLGAELSMTPMGEYTGTVLIKTNMKCDAVPFSIYDTNSIKVTT